jgi:hypothetical protein
MELTGDEKKIQALFSELRLEAGSEAPRFEKLWNSAASNTTTRVGVFDRSLVILFASVLILASIGAFAWWTRDVSTSSVARNEAKVLPQVASIVAQSPTVELKKPVSNAAIRSRRVAHRKSMRSQTAESAVIQNAAVLSRWQSPTDVLMESTAALVLKSLPALNESAKDLESYLSDNELKETKQ